jgi:hypothetical protein
MSTLDCVPQLLLGYLGYTSAFFGIEPEAISLKLYADPKYVARFIGYLQARGVGIGQLAKVLSLARKVNDYLQSGAEEGSPVRQHAARMESWLMRLLAQLHASRPAKPKADAPDIITTWEWVEKLVERALDMVDHEMRAEGCIGHNTAIRVHQALVASLVTGCYCPPNRLHVLLSLIHPHYNGRLPCTDRDCLNGVSCIGNHLQLVNISALGQGQPSIDSSSDDDSNWEHFGYKTRGVRLVVVHQKNDR